MIENFKINEFMGPQCAVMPMSEYVDISEITKKKYLCIEDFIVCNENGYSPNKYINIRGVIKDKVYIGYDVMDYNKFIDKLNENIGDTKDREKIIEYNIRIYNSFRDNFLLIKV
jgi:hypothetical protein